MSDPITFRWQHNATLASSSYPLPATDRQIADQLTAIKSNRFFQKINKDQYDEVICTSNGVFFKKREDGKILSIDEMGGMFDRKEILKIRGAARAIVRQALAVEFDPLFTKKADDSGSGFSSVGSSPSLERDVSSTDSGLTMEVQTRLEKLDEMEMSLQGQIQKYQERSEALGETEESLSRAMAANRDLQSHIERLEGELDRVQSQHASLESVEKKSGELEKVFHAQGLQIQRLMSSIQGMRERLKVFDFIVPESVEAVPLLIEGLCMVLGTTQKELETLRAKSEGAKKASTSTIAALEAETGKVGVDKQILETEIRTLKESMGHFKSELDREKRRTALAEERVETEAIKADRLSTTVETLRARVSEQKEELDAVRDVLSIEPDDTLMGGVHKIAEAMQGRLAERDEIIAAQNERIKTLEVALRNKLG